MCDIGHVFYRPSLIGLPVPFSSFFRLSLFDRFSPFERSQDSSAWYIDRQDHEDMYAMSRK